MWVVFALAASILWGLTYAINEQVYKKVSILTSLGITSLLSSIIILLISYFGRHLKQDIVTIANSQRLVVLVAAETIVLMLAELFIGLSITHKNATLAGLIEISYPIFIVLFAFIIFNESQFTVSTAAGGVLIFLGVVVIYHFSK